RLQPGRKLGHPPPCGRGAATGRPASSRRWYAIERETRATDAQPGESQMKRRELLRSAVLAGAAASVGRLTIAQPPGRLPARPDKTRLIVDGLDVSTLNETYVGLLKRGGVDCWHKSVGGEVEGVGQVYRFVDDHSA